MVTGLQIQSHQQLRASHIDNVDVLVWILRGEAKAVVERTLINTKGTVVETEIDPPPKPADTQEKTTVKVNENGSPLPRKLLLQEKTALVVDTTHFEFTNHLIKRKLAAFQPKDWKPYWKSDAH